MPLSTTAMAASPDGASLYLGCATGGWVLTANTQEIQAHDVRVASLDGGEEA